MGSASDSSGSLSDMVMEFFEEEERAGSAASSCYDNGSDDEGESRNSGSAKENIAFWEAQHQLLQEELSKSSSAERRIRAETEKLVRELGEEGGGCGCSSQSNTEWCRNCTMRVISDRLKAAGYDSALCRSKWQRSPEIPSGEHSYIDAMVETKSGKRSSVRIVIELNFRGEFEMARASAEYNRLVGSLPEVFVGKSERLRSVIKILCGAAKKCLKDNKMHMAPWRKHKYMQAKWLAACERSPRPGPLLTAAAGRGGRQPRARTSMLTFDLHCTAVEVV